MCVCGCLFFFGVVNWGVGFIVCLFIFLFVLCGCFVCFLGGFGESRLVLFWFFVGGFV